MSESQDLWKDLSAGRDAILSSIVLCKERASIGRSNAGRKAKIDAEIKQLEDKVQVLRAAINHTTQLYKNIENYVIRKKEASMKMLKLAIEKAGLIVPNADTNGIQLKIGEKTACVVNDLGQDINLREGSAFRTVMGILMKYAIQKAQPDALQILILDETFSTLSDETINMMREFIAAFSEDMLIVGIEQRNYLYSGLERTTYRASKNSEGESKIRRIDEDAT